MKGVKVLYFASLRELLGHAEQQIEVVDAITAQAVWHQLNPHIALPESCLVAINQEYANLSSVVQAGDEVAFFPPVTGG